MAVYKLALYPELAAEQYISEQQIDGLIEQLRALRFLDEREIQVDGVTRYLLGEACMSQLTFLGCSPFIELDPPAENAEEAARQGKFCHLTVSCFDEPRWRVDPTARPRCPACRKSVKQQELLIADAITCPNCNATSPAMDWQWRSLAGRGSLFVDIWGVFTSEAVPNPPLLEALASVTSTPWKYFYVKD